MGNGISGKGEGGQFYVPPPNVVLRFAHLNLGFPMVYWVRERQYNGYLHEDPHIILPVSKSECSDGSQVPKLLLHASHVALQTSIS
jgi:hypothetical protein